MYREYKQTSERNLSSGEATCKEEIVLVGLRKTIGVERNARADLWTNKTVMLAGACFISDIVLHVRCGAERPSCRPSAASRLYR